MSRTIPDIQTQIISSVSAEPSLSQLTSSSQTAIWRLWTYIVAVAISVFEQILDQATLNFETIVSNAVVGNEQWWIAQMRAFQYSADPANAQAVSLVNFVPQYPRINPALQIVTQVAVVVTDNRAILIKAAKGQAGSLLPLNATELVAAQAYVNLIQPAGNNVQVISLFPDRLQLTATVYYDGQYTQANVKAAVITAITNYLFSISNANFNGNVSLLHLTDAVQAVPGVSDFVISNAMGRMATISPGTGTAFTRVYAPDAGYIIPEDTTYTLDTTLTMSAV